RAEARHAVDPPPGRRARGDRLDVPVERPPRLPEVGLPGRGVRPVARCRAQARDLRPRQRPRLTRAARALDTPLGLVALFASGLIVRLILAPRVGFYGDLRLFREWAGRLDAVGPRHFYVKGQFQDYPPGYLYVLWLTGKISSAPSYLLL